MFRGPRYLRNVLVTKPVVRIQNRVAKIIECRAVEAIRSRTRCKSYLSAGRTTELRSKRGRFDSELLQGIDGDKAAGASYSAESLRGSGSGLPHSRGRTGTKIGRHAVD